MLANILFFILAVGCPILMAAGVLLLIDRLFPKRKPVGGLQGGPYPYHQPDVELLHPDWAFYESHLQRPAPTALRALYADENLITLCCFDYGEESINSFGPLNAGNVLEANPIINFDVVPIATTDFGDPVYLLPGPVEADRVYVTHHDGGDTVILAGSAEDFLSTLMRKYGPAAGPA